MCGIAAILSSQTFILPRLKTILSSLQHRGYDGCGFSFVSDIDNSLLCYKGVGTIDKVLEHVGFEHTHIGIGHTRYKTHGHLDPKTSQPILSKNSSIALVHNGHITNSTFDLDSKSLLYYFEKYLQFPCNEQNIIKVIQKIYQNVIGSYSVIVLIKDFGLVAFRDPRGIRPLVYSNTPTQLGIASESVALNNPIFNSIHDVYPNECLIARSTTNVKLSPIFKDKMYEITPCVFEYIYLASPESIMNNIHIGAVRVRFGAKLGMKMNTQFKPLVDSVDLVVPIPKTSCTITKSLAIAINKEYVDDIIQLNPSYIRSFMLPTQDARKQAIFSKFKINIKGHEYDNFLMVDDSIVRGNTIQNLIKRLKENGHKGKIYVASISPPIRYINCYGIDLPTQQELIAYNKNEFEIAKELGVDRVIYQNLEDLLDCLHFVNPDITNYECSVFDGIY